MITHLKPTLILLPLLLIQGFFISSVIHSQTCRICQPKIRECCPPVGHQCVKRCPKAIAVILPPLPTAVSLKNAFELALQDIKKTIDGDSFFLVFLDGKADEKTMRKLTEDVLASGVLAVVDTTESQATNTTVKLLSEARVPVVLTSASSDVLTKPGSRWVFRVGPARSFWWEPLLSFLSEDARDIRSVDLFVPASSQQIYQTLITDLREMEIRVKSSAFLASSDFLHLVKDLPSTQPNGVIIASREKEAQNLLTSIHKVGYRPKLTNLVVPPLFDLKGFEGHMDPKILEGAFASGTRPGAESNSQFVSFKTRFASRFGQEPRVQESLAYSSLLMISNSINRAVTATLKASKALTLEDIRTALMQTETNTPFGRVVFSSFAGFRNQNPTTQNAETVLWQWQEGTRKVVWPHFAREAKPIYPLK